MGRSFFVFSKTKKNQKIHVKTQIEYFFVFFKTKYLQFKKTHKKQKSIVFLFLRIFFVFLFKRIFFVFFQKKSRPKQKKG